MSVLDRKADFQGFYVLHMVGPDDPHFSWVPLTAWGVSANIPKLSLSHFQVHVVMWANKCHIWLLQMVESKLVRLWWASCSAGCAPSAGSSCSTSPPISSSAGASFSPGFSIRNSFAVTYKNKLWRNEIATKWVSPQFSLPIIVIVTESVWQSRGDEKRKLTSFSTSPCLGACLGWPPPLPSLSLSINQSIFNNISIRFSKNKLTKLSRCDS